MDKRITGLLDKLSETDRVLATILTELSEIVATLQANSEQSWKFLHMRVDMLEDELSKIKSQVGLESEVDADFDLDGGWDDDEDEDEED